MAPLLPWLAAAVAMAGALLWIRQPRWRLECLSPAEGVYKLTNVGRVTATNVRLLFKEPRPKLTRQAGPWATIRPQESVIFVALNAHGLPYPRIGVRAAQSAALTWHRLHQVEIISANGGA